MTLRTCLFIEQVQPASNPKGLIVETTIFLFLIMVYYKIMDIEEICKKYGILALYAFGSKAKEVVELFSGSKAGGGDLLLSDVDIGVVFFQPPREPKQSVSLYKNLYAELAELFKPYQLDLIFLQQAGIILQFQAINGYVLYSADEDKRLDYEEQVIKIYQDYKIDYEQYIKEVLEAVSE